VQGFDCVSTRAAVLCLVSWMGRERQVAPDRKRPGCRQCRTGTGVLAFGRALPCPVQASDGLRPALPCPVPAFGRHSVPQCRPVPAFGRALRAPVPAFGRRMGSSPQCTVALSASWDANLEMREEAAGKMLKVRWEGYHPSWEVFRQEGEGKRGDPVLT